MKLIIGSAQFGMHYGIANLNGKMMTRDVNELLYNAYKFGINSIDTAQGYGNSEHVIGNYLKQNSDQDWEIITKINDFDRSLEESISSSKNNFGNVQIDVLAHSLEYYNEMLSLDYVKKIKSEGIVRKVGVSIYNPDEVTLLLNGSMKPDIIQLPLNILDTHLLKNGTIDLIKREKIEIHARSVFLQGLFFLKNEIIQKKFPEALEVIKKLKNIALEMKMTLPQLSLAWLYSLNCIDKIIIGSDNWSQLNQSIVFLNNVKFEELNFKKALSLNYKNKKITNPSLW